MYIHANMQGSGTLLLALDGLVVGLVVEADTEQGWLRRYDTSALKFDPPSPSPRSTGSVASLKDFDAAADEHRRRIAGCPIVMVHGHVDFVGDTATDPDWMIAQRVAAIRIRHGLPITPQQAADAGSATAAVLERLASRVRSGDVQVSTLGQSRRADFLPLPGGGQKALNTGVYDLHLSYVAPGEVKAFQDARDAWARDNPDLVPVYVNAAQDEKKAP